MATEGGVVIEVVKRHTGSRQTHKHNISHLQQQCKTIRNTQKTGRLLLVYGENFLWVLDQPTRWTAVFLSSEMPLKVVRSSHRGSEHTCGTFVFVILNEKNKKFEQQHTSEIY